MGMAKTHSLARMLGCATNEVTKVSSNVLQVHCEKYLVLTTREIPGVFKDKVLSEIYKYPSGVIFECLNSRWRSTSAEYTWKHIDEYCSMGIEGNAELLTMIKKNAFVDKIRALYGYELLDAEHSPKLVDCYWIYKM